MGSLKRGHEVVAPRRTPGQGGVKQSRTEQNRFLVSCSIHFFFMKQCLIREALSSIVREREREIGRPRNIDLRRRRGVRERR